MSKVLSLIIESLSTLLSSKAVSTLLCCSLISACGFHLRNIEATSKQTTILVKQAPQSFIAYVQKRIKTKCDNKRCLKILSLENSEYLSQLQTSSQLRFLALKSDITYTFCDKDQKDLIMPKQKSETHHITQNLQTLRADESLISLERKKVYKELLEEIEVDLKLTRLRSRRLSR